MSDAPKLEPIPIDKAIAARAAKAQKAAAIRQAKLDLALDEMGYARRFARANATKLRYCPAAKEWYVWAAIRWARDDRNVAMKAAIEVIDGLALEAEQATSKDQRAAIFEAMATARRDRIAKAILSIASADKALVVTPVELDSHSNLLNTPGGTVDLRTGRIGDHLPEDLITRLTGSLHDPKAECPRWKQFISEIMDGDLEMISWLQTAVGYSVTASVAEQVFFLCHGTGANGKSVFIETISAVLGDYARSTDAETFLHQPGGARIPSDLAALVPVRFVALPEVPAGRRLNEQRVKQFVGGDTIDVRELFGKWFNFRPIGKLWLTANEVPRITERSHGMWRRVRLVPFNVQFEGDARDRTLAKKLRAEYPGILRWIVEGAIFWHQNGLGVPVKVAAATLAYEESQDPIAHWLADRCVRDSGQTSGKALFDSYVAWTEANAVEPIGRTLFGKALHAAGFAQVRTKTSRAWAGISLIAADEPYEPDENG